MVVRDREENGVMSHMKGIDVDIKKVATQLEALASDLRKAGQERTK
jgi:hypothetical protein